jgi:arylsulfatase A-like enzyme
MKKPNILLIVSDQERQRDWLPAGAKLPARQRLIDGGLEFTQYYTHTSPCSPSRATLFTGRYLAQHGVLENSSMPGNTELPLTTPTLGHVLRRAGYRTAYKGKWHLQAREVPQMDEYGFGDWEGNDSAWWGLPCTGTEFDEPIAEQSARWLREQASTSTPASQPWFLTVALVNPHDIMWFPLDQQWWWKENPEFVARERARLARRDWGRKDNLPGFAHPLDEWFSELPPNFDDDLFTKPDVQRRWTLERERQSPPGLMRRDDPRIWLQQLNYYVKLHELNDRCIATVLGALDAIGGWDDTIVIFTSDHGEQCGAHGLRSKGPWNYQETMRIPLYMHVPGRTRPGSKTAALATHVDLARTIAEFAGVDLRESAGPAGESLSPLFADQRAKVRDYVLFAQEWAWYRGVEQTRFASTGIFDGRHKYCRYYGIGSDGRDSGGNILTGPMLVPPTSGFEDHDHEWYDLANDPHELVNLAHDRGRRAEMRRRFEELRGIEATAYAPVHR